MCRFCDLVWWQRKGRTRGSRYGGSVVEFINVRISNAKWNYAFVLADLYKAHADGFRNNDNVLDLVVHGYASATVP